MLSIVAVSFFFFFPLVAILAGKKKNEWKVLLVVFGPTNREVTFIVKMFDYVP